MNKNDLAQVISAAINKLQELNNEKVHHNEEMTIGAIEAVLQNPGMSAEDMHEHWLKEKIKDGWKYGPVKDYDKKENPNMVEYEKLSDFQKMKDIVVITLVNAYINLVEQPITEVHEDDRIIRYSITEERKNKIIEKLLDYYFKYGLHGEVIIQRDNAIIHAPECLSDIADEIIKFKVEWLE